MYTYRAGHKEIAGSDYAEYYNYFKNLFISTILRVAFNFSFNRRMKKARSEWISFADRRCDIQNGCADATNDLRFRLLQGL